MEFLHKGEDKSFSPDRDLAWLFRGIIGQALERLKGRQSEAAVEALRQAIGEEDDLASSAEALLEFMYKDDIKLKPGETRVGRCRKEFKEAFAKADDRSTLVLMAEIGYLTTWTAWLGWRDAAWKGKSTSPAVDREELQAFAAAVGKAAI